MKAVFDRVSWIRAGGRVACALACAALLLAAAPAQAVLGGDAASIADDQSRLKGLRAPAKALQAPGAQQAQAQVQVQVQAHEITLADGSSIREYVSSDGIVFAVAWSTRFKPDLAALLGRHAASYAAAASDAMKAPGIRRHVQLRGDDLVVHSSAHLNSFVGKAYVPSLVPSGVQIDALR